MENVETHVNISVKTDRNIAILRALTAWIEHEISHKTPPENTSGNRHISDLIAVNASSRVRNLNLWACQKTFLFSSSVIFPILCHKSGVKSWCCFHPRARMPSKRVILNTAWGLPQHPGLSLIYWLFNLFSQCIVPTYPETCTSYVRGAIDIDFWGLRYFILVNQLIVKMLAVVVHGQFNHRLMI